MQPPSRRLVVGFKVQDKIPTDLCPLIDEVVACYQRYHPDVRAVYAMGSVVLGEWKEGVSDLDVIGVLNEELSGAEESSRRNELQTIVVRYPQVQYVNSTTLSLDALYSRPSDIQILKLARVIAIYGLHIWGETLDFSVYYPSVETLARERAARAEIQMRNFRAGRIKEPTLRNSPRLIARSSAKAAMRVFSSITILRGAVFYEAPQKTFSMIAEFAPEALSLAQRAIAIVNGAEAEPDEAMSITEQAVELFYRLYPDTR